MTEHLSQHNALQANEEASAVQVIAAFHRHAACSALSGKGSTMARLAHYNHHMDQARALEAQGGAR